MDRTKYVKTPQDWYPNFPGDTIRVRVFDLPLRRAQDAPHYRICVWGADDFGMELDSFDKEHVDAIFDRIQDNTSQEKLASWGLRLLGRSRNTSMRFWELGLVSKT